MKLGYLLYNSTTSCSWIGMVISSRVGNAFTTATEAVLLEFDDHYPGLRAAAAGDSESRTQRPGFRSNS